MAETRAHRRHQLHRLHRAHHALRNSWRHSLRLRLIVLFLVLAAALTLTFIGGMQRAMSLGWRDAARPLVVDYVDHLVADLGSLAQSVRLTNTKRQFCRPLLPIGSFPMELPITRLVCY